MKIFKFFNWFIIYTKVQFKFKFVRHRENCWTLLLFGIAIGNNYDVFFNEL
jgi:hypothetical protein